MDLGFLMDYVDVVIVGICLCVGFVIKNLIPDDAINKYIPCVMAALGLILNIWTNKFAISPVIILGGLISGLASTGLYELFRNFIEKKGE